MADQGFPQHAKSLTTSTGTTYSYVFIPPSSPEKPTLLMLHGFPSSSYDWRFQIAHFGSPALGYGVVAPDLLGYGRTDRPTDHSAYRGKKMAREIVDILDAEGYNETNKKVHGIAHDWGFFLLSRLCNWYPGWCASATFMSVGYEPPRKQFQVDAVNQMTKKMLGWEMFGYVKFLEREDAAEVVKDHFDSFYSILYAADAEVWKTSLAPLGALEAFIKSDKTVEMGSYITEQDKQNYVQIMNKDLDAAMNWYRCSSAGLNLPDENNASPPLDPKLHIPVLYIESSHDVLSGGEHTIQGMQAVIPDLTVKKIAAGHWVQLEKADEVNEVLDGWFAEFLIKEKAKA